MQLINLDVESLDPITKQTLTSLLEPRFQACLTNQHPDGIKETKSFIIAVYDQDNLIAALVSSYIAPLKICEIHQFAIKESLFRFNEDIFEKMLEFLLQQLKASFPVLITFTYSTKDKKVPFFETVFKKLEWGIRPFVKRYYFNQSLFNPPWLFKHYPLPRGFSQFYWEDLTDQERKRLVIQQQQSTFDQAFTPFHDEKKIEFMNSFGLRHQKEVVGWMITHRLSSELIRYSNLYIRKEWQNQGIMIRLLCDAIKIQKEKAIPEAMLEANLILADSSWLSFLESRLLSLTSSQELMNQAWKTYRPEGPLL